MTGNGGSDRAEAGVRLCAFSPCWATGAGQRDNAGDGVSRR